MDDKFMPRPAGVGKTTGNANLPLPVRDDDGWKEEGDARSGGDGGAMIVKNRPQAEEEEGRFMVVRTVGAPPPRRLLVVQRLGRRACARSGFKVSPGSGDGGRVSWTVREGP